MQVFPFDLQDNEYVLLMNSLQVSNSGISIMSGRFSAKTFMITGISTPGANVVKQHVLAMGGEAAVPAYSVNCSQPKCDLIFSVREDKLPILLEKFKSQCWKLPEVAKIIENYMENKSPWFSFRHDLIDIARPSIMGILNVTPDSFSDGGKYDSVDKAIIKAEEMIQKGADIIDIGGESTRPGSDPVPAGEEALRVIPVVSEIKKRFPQKAVSIDTTKSEVAKKAIDVGADIVNDISGLNFDEKMVSICAETKVPVILMHILETPQTMQSSPHYEKLLPEMIQSLKNSVQKAVAGGIEKEKIIVDPGIGFGKTCDHNLFIIKHLEAFQVFGLPVLTGVSRKSVIGMITGRKDPSERIIGTSVLNTLSIDKGVAIIRVHDIMEAKETMDIVLAVKESKCL
jgi:dihydropteroate synthase